MSEHSSNPTQLSRMRLPVALLWIALCLVGMWFSARVGYARLVARYASVTGNLAAANKAVELTPLDAQTHRVRSIILQNNGDVIGAAKELELAVSLRPRDDYLWLQLGVIRDELGQPEALLAFNESVRLAPYYAHPQWQRGNFLLRGGNYEDAFADLRTAAASNKTLVPTLIDLAWGVSRKNPEITQRWAGITDDKMRISFALFLARQGKARDALEQFRACKVVPNQVRTELLQELIGANGFREAFEIWKGIERSGDDAIPSIHDGDFESRGGFDNTGFGWRFSQTLQGMRLSLDRDEAQSGSQSMLINFQGYSDPASVILSQLVIVEPGKRYRLKFRARTKEIVTGGLPVITITDASGEKKQLGQSNGIESDSWSPVSFDFQATNTTEAITLGLQRNRCHSDRCPIFGSLWLDDFSIEELK